MANSVSQRSTFVNSAVTLLRDYGFDGLDLDWEYPAQRGGLSYDKHNLVTLSQEKVEQGYDVPNLDKYLDFYNIMAYDFHGGWDGVTGHNSPLYASSQDFGDDLFLNVNYSVNYWRTSGASIGKLIVGLPAYGRTFTLSSSSNYGVGAPASTGPAGTYTREAGFFSYYEICSEIKRSAGIRVVDDYMKTPYFVKDNVWIGYDDIPTFQLKANFIKDNQFGGMMVWSLALDDFNNVCGTGEYPLIKAASQTLNTPSGVGTTQSNNQPDTNTNQPTTSKPTTSVVANIPTTAKPSADSSEAFSCSGKTDGSYRDPKECSGFYTCSNGIEHKQTCAHGLHFDTKSAICNWANQVDC
ncbi:hypothetical protein LOTGIDRAFT_155415 [Lottia gigantea]|uniref:Uncharacterized protein n=1 Tax=Lottia gigantea TaxID=225164 RepID=V3Z0R7_LOTGI|nr:hypothetical protein LOTGIDRAFT_155415 [Lottia gigantea]ESO84093.1 hypothetical protein LOTGIDRAFT_155415 [Lottia gigantea]